VVVAIAGAHGKIALRLIPLLAKRGDGVIGLIRNPDHAEEVTEAGASPVVCDLERATIEEIAVAIEDADAVVFSAGAGPGSGAERKVTMDRDGAVKLLAAAGRVGAGRYVIVSSVGAEDPPDEDDVFGVYLRAKAEADAAVMASDRLWTVVRPGGLTDDPGTGRVRLSAEPYRGRVPRDDVAAVLARLLHDERTTGLVLYINGGEVPIDEAVESAVGLH
jgi:nucleoside-diphosphate-sugar epimerase